MKKEEKVILPDGTIYYFSATWIPDPTFMTNVTRGTQTDNTRLIDAETNTPVLVKSIREHEVQTEDILIIEETTDATQQQEEQTPEQTQDTEEIPWFYIN